MTLVLMGIAAVVVVLVMFIVFTGIKAEGSMGGEDMIKNVYIYLVLFATLMMTIGGSVGVFMAVADIIAPVPYHQTFEEYKHMREVKDPTSSRSGEEENLSEEELRQQYEAMVEAEKERQANRAKNNLIKSFGWIIIPLPVFIYFQRRLVNQII